MSDDDAAAVGAEAGYVAPKIEPLNEREHGLRNQGFRDGYAEGRDDLLFALARHHDWALQELKTAKEIHRREVALTAAITAERDKAK